MSQGPEDKGTRSEGAWAESHAPSRLPHGKRTQRRPLKTGQSWSSTGQDGDQDQLGKKLNDPRKTGYMSQPCPRHLACHPDKPHHRLRKAKIPPLSIPSGNVSGFYFNPPSEISTYHRRLSRAGEAGGRGQNSPLLPGRGWLTLFLTS